MKHHLFVSSLHIAWNRLDTNVMALVAMTKAFVAGMMERNAGHIVNIGSVAGHESYAGGVCAPCASLTVQCHGYHAHCSNTFV